MLLRVLDIVDGTIVDGPGLRTSIYLAGCAHQCPGCHNPQSWDFDGGYQITTEELVARVEANDMDVSLSGGDPLYQIDGVIDLCQRIRRLGRNIWCYTGFTYEEILGNQALNPILKAVDVLVDGPYKQALHDSSLRFRGSSNQRLIDLSLSQGPDIVLWEPTALHSLLK